MPALTLTVKSFIGTVSGRPVADRLVGRSVEICKISSIPFFDSVFDRLDHLVDDLLVESSLGLEISCLHNVRPSRPTKNGIGFDLMPLRHLWKFENRNSDFRNPMYSPAFSYTTLRKLSPGSARNPFIPTVKSFIGYSISLMIYWSVVLGSVALNLQWKILPVPVSESECKFINTTVQQWKDWPLECRVEHSNVRFDRWNVRFDSSLLMGVSSYCQFRHSNERFDRSNVRFDRSMLDLTVRMSDWPLEC